MQSLISTLLVAGSALALALPTSTNSTNQTCMSKGEKVSAWTVENFDFHASYIFTTPAHQNSWGNVNFVLINPALDYKAVCRASSDQLYDFFYDFSNWDCDVPVDGDTASFSFNRPNGALAINQTWNCLAEGGRFYAHGSTTLDLKCDESTWQNPDWKQGETYSTRNIQCKDVTVQAPVTEMSAVL